MMYLKTQAKQMGLDKMRNKVALETMIPKGRKKMEMGLAEGTIYVYVQANASVHNG